MERPFLFGTVSVVMWQRIRSMFVPAEPQPSDAPRSRITIVSVLLDDQDRSLITEVCFENQWDVFFAKTCAEALIHALREARAERKFDDGGTRAADNEAISWAMDIIQGTASMTPS